MCFVLNTYCPLPYGAPQETVSNRRQAIKERAMKHVKLDTRGRSHMRVEVEERITGATGAVTVGQAVRQDCREEIEMDDDS